MKLNLTRKILLEATYKLFYYRKAFIPFDTPEEFILKRTPEFTLETQAITPEKARNNAPLKYLREIRKKKQIYQTDLENFHKKYLVIARPTTPPKMVQGTLF